MYLPINIFRVIIKPDVISKQEVIAMPLNQHNKYSKKCFFSLVYLTLLALLWPMLLTTPTASAQAGKEKILFIPHDDRPTSGPISAEAVEMLGYEVIMPPQRMLGGLYNAGNPDQLAEWTQNHIQDTAAAVISADALIYGGLVASRQHQLTQEELNHKVEQLVQLNQLKSNYPVYVFTSLMRTPANGAAAGTEEPPYYQLYGDKIFRRSGLLDKADSHGLTQAENDELWQLSQEIPEHVWQDWSQRRAKNLQVTKALMTAVKAGKLDYLVIGKDDNAPLSATHMESRQLTEYGQTLGLKPNRFQLLSGIDEFAMLLLTRSVNKLAGLEPKVYVTYNEGIGSNTIPHYSDEAIGHTVQAAAAITDSKLVNKADQADLILLVHTNPDGSTKEIGSDKPAYTETTERFGAATLRLLDQGYKVALADIAFANGADSALMDWYHQHNALLRLTSYAGWNTPTNSTGFALGQGLLARMLPAADCHRLLMERYLDDWVFQSEIRQEMYGVIKGYHNPAIFEHFGALEPELTAITQERMQGYIQQHLPFYPEIASFRFFYPWHILFIGGIQLP